jgi:DnaJ-class molecular chaperone
MCSNASGMSQMQVLSDEEKRERWDAGEDVFDGEDGHGQGHGNPFWHMQQGGAQFHFQWEH